MIRKLKIPLRIFLLFLPLALSGCIKSNTTVVVNEDGTAQMTAEIGFPVELVAEMTFQGIDPVKDLKQILFSDLPRGTKFDEFEDSSYEYLQTKINFNTVEELGNFLTAQDYFESFNLQRNRGFLQDQFTLNAQFTPQNFTDPFDFEPEGDVVKPSENDPLPMDFQFSIQLPGSVVETNGLHDDATNMITWSAENTDALAMQATSETWNTLSLIATASLSILGIALVAAIVIVIIRTRRKGKPELVDMEVEQRLFDSAQPVVEEEETESTEPDVEEVFPPSKILAMIGARELLEQVNHHVLNDRGEITSAKGAIRLVWTDQENTVVTRGIMITVQDSDTIMINGVPFPANREAARQGLISCLKGMTKQ